MIKEIRNYTKINETVHLNKDVVVSDPCYSLGTWCQAILNNVKPGEYVIEYYKAKDSGVGHAFCLTHKNYKLSVFPKEHYSVTLGIDSGQVGVFPLEEFRNDSIIPDNHAYFIKVHDINEPGEKWYCGIVPIWWVTPYRLVKNCFNSESGYGDGVAELRVSTNSKGEIYRIAVIF